MRPRLRRTVCGGVVHCGGAEAASTGRRNHQRAIGLQCRGRGRGEFDDGIVIDDGDVGLRLRSEVRAVRRCRGAQGHTEGQIAVNVVVVQDRDADRLAAGFTVHPRQPGHRLVIVDAGGGRPIAGGDRHGSRTQCSAAARGADGDRAAILVNRERRRVHFDDGVIIGNGDGGGRRIQQGDRGGRRRIAQRDAEVFRCFWRVIIQDGHRHGLGAGFAIQPGHRAAGGGVVRAGDCAAVGSRIVHRNLTKGAGAGQRNRDHTFVLDDRVGCGIQCDGAVVIGDNRRGRGWLHQNGVDLVIQDQLELFVTFQLGIANDREGHRLGCVVTGGPGYDFGLGLVIDIGFSRYRVELRGADIDLRGLGGRTHAFNSGHDGAPIFTVGYEGGVGEADAQSVFNGDRRRIGATDLGKGAHGGEFHREALVALSVVVGHKRHGELLDGIGAFAIRPGEGARCGGVVFWRGGRAI